MLPIQLAAGLGYLIGHYLLSRRRASGWLVRILGGIAWIAFLYISKNFIFMAVMAVIVLTMTYGFYKWRSGISERITSIDRSFEILTMAVAVFMVLFFILNGKYSTVSAMETLIVVAEMSGTMLLARRHVIGWHAYIVMSILVSILVIFVNPDPAVPIGLLELASIYFYVRGIINMRLGPSQIPA